jgi:anthranilate phosphoribosyltransferase
LLSGNGSEAETDIVALNTGALLLAAGLSADLRMGVALARDALRRGKAGQLLSRFIEASND